MGSYMKIIRSRSRLLAWNAIAPSPSLNESMTAIAVTTSPFQWFSRPGSTGACAARACVVGTLCSLPQTRPAWLCIGLAGGLSSIERRAILWLGDVSWKAP